MIKALRALINKIPIIGPKVFPVKMTLYVENQNTKTIEKEIDWGRFLLQPTVGASFEAVNHGLMKECPDKTLALDPNDLRFVKKDADNITQIREVYNPAGDKIEYFIKQIDVTEYQKSCEEAQERTQRNMSMLEKLGPYAGLGVIFIISILLINNLSETAKAINTGSASINTYAAVLADHDELMTIAMQFNKTPYHVKANDTGAAAAPVKNGLFGLW